MRSLIRKLKCRRTSLSEAGEPGADSFELQRVPEHKKRNHQHQGSKHVAFAHEQPDETVEQPEPPMAPSRREPPSFMLTTPEGLDTSAIANTADDYSDSDEWGTDDEDDDEPRPLVSESPRKLTGNRIAHPPAPHRPASRPAPLDAFVLGPPDDTTLISPFADPQHTVGEEPGSWWSSWSSSSSSSTSSVSSDSDSDSDETIMSAGPYHYQPLYQPAATGSCKTPDGGFVSFPPLLSPEMQTFLAELDPADERDAQELLLEAEWVDEEEDGDGGEELMRAVESAESEWAGAFSRPVPQWLWLTSSTSFPLFRASRGPADLRHGGSKLRMAASVG